MMAPDQERCAHGKQSCLAIRHTGSAGRSDSDLPASDHVLLGVGEWGRKLMHAHLTERVLHQPPPPQRRGPGGQPGNHSASRAAGLHPEHRRFGQATPGPATHPTAPAAAFPAPLPSQANGRPGQGPRRSPAAQRRRQGVPGAAAREPTVPAAGRALCTPTSTGSAICAAA